MPSLLPHSVSPVTTRRALAGLALLALIFGLVWWQAPTWQMFKGDGANTLFEPDVCIVAPPTPYDRASGLSMYAARPVPADVRCPVCGMFPSRSPEWAAQVIFTNGDAQFFDSPLSLFMYLGNVARYSPGRSAGDIVAHYVTDVPGRRWIDARSAYYVTGSTAKGPMRAGNLPAFASQEEAQRFAARRGGKVLAFADVDDALVAQLGGQGTHSH